MPEIVSSPGNRNFIFFCFFGLLVFHPKADAQVSQNSFEDFQPRYEYGVGAIGLNIPDYPGSKRNQMRVVPFPWFIYRGDYMRTDDEGTRARFFSSEHYETGLGLYFNFPVNSNDHTTRRGMPNLDYLIGLGPRFMLRILPKRMSHRFNFVVSVGGVYSTNFKTRFQSQGIFIKSGFNYWYYWKETKTTIFSGLNFEFGSVELNRYFYEVKPHEVTTNRPLYRAKPGLVETSLSVGFGRNIARNLLFFAGGFWRNLDLSENRQSPLIETNNNAGFLLGMVWTFLESEQKVPKPQLENPSVASLPQEIFP